VSSDTPAEGELFARRAGLLLPISSAPGRHGIGDLGPGARQVIDWCAAAGFGWWQMLPVNPVGPGNSPYSSSSAFAGEPLYLSLEALVDEGLLSSADLKAPATMARGPVRYHEVREYKLARLEQAFRTWSGRRGSRRRFDRFCEEQSGWLEPWAEYVSGGEEEAARRARFLQFQFDLQWRALRSHASSSGVRLMGDAPIFVGAESADVRAHPELFRLDRSGAPKVLTGCPPDSFTEDGQLWGHPHYAWRAHRADGFAWWRRRMARQLELFDAVRVDHFIGFHKAWEVPASDDTARNGRWGRTPGRELLDALGEELGGLPLVAEDLGAVDEGVLALRDEYDLPGMRILQWGFSRNSSHAPEHCPEGSVVYPGTHDNDTAAGWWRQLPRAERRRFLARSGGSVHTVSWDLWRMAAGTASHTAIVQLQDLLGLGRAARMNTPGTTRGNWRWRAGARDLSRSLAGRSRELNDATNRLA